MSRCLEPNIPRNARRSLNPLRPWSKLLCVTANHLSSSGSIRSPSGPRTLFNTLSSFSGSSLTFHTDLEGSFVICGEKGAFILSGVCIHRGSSPDHSDRQVVDVEKEAVGRHDGATDWLLQPRTAWRESLAANREVLSGIGYDVAFFMASLEHIK